MEEQEKKKRRRSFWPILLIVVGGLWLASSLGLAFDWGIMLPALLIALGLFYIVDPSQPRSGIFFVLLILLLFFVVSFFFTSSSPFNWRIDVGNFVSERIDTTKKELSIAQSDFPDVREMKLIVDIGSGTYQVDTEAPEGNYLTSEATYNYEQFAPELTAEALGDVLVARYTTVRRDGFSGFTPQAIHSYDIHLSQDSIPVDAQLSIGSGTAEARFANKALSSLLADVGSGQMRIDFENSLPQNLAISSDVGSGRVSLLHIPIVSLASSDIAVGSGSVSLSFSGIAPGSDVLLDISVGSGKLDLEIPKNLPCIISADIGSGDLVVDGEKREAYTSPSYDADAPALQINATVGSGDMRILLIEP